MIPSRYASSCEFTLRTRLRFCQKRLLVSFLWRYPHKNRSVGVSALNCKVLLPKWCVGLHIYSLSSRNTHVPTTFCLCFVSYYKVVLFFSSPNISRTKTGEEREAETIRGYIVYAPRMDTCVHSLQVVLLTPIQSPRGGTDTHTVDNCNP